MLCLVCIKAKHLHFSLICAKKLFLLKFCRLYNVAITFAVFALVNHTERQTWCHISSWKPLLQSWFGRLCTNYLHLVCWLLAIQPVCRVDFLNHHFNDISVQAQNSQCIQRELLQKFEKIRLDFSSYTSADVWGLTPNIQVNATSMAMCKATKAAGIMWS